MSTQSIVPSVFSVTDGGKRVSESHATLAAPLLHQLPAMWLLSAFLPQSLWLVMVFLPMHVSVNLKQFTFNH